MGKSIKILLLSFGLLVGLGQGVEWYEQGEGGWTPENDTGIVPTGSGLYENTGTATSIILDGDVPIGEIGSGTGAYKGGDLMGAFYNGELRGIIEASTVTLPPSPYFGEPVFFQYILSNNSFCDRPPSPSASKSDV